MRLRTPYLLFLGDAPDMLAAKVARGVADWRPEHALGQLRLPGCAADVGAPDMSVAEAAAAGAQTLVVGVANRGGVISQAWLPTLLAAIEAGMDVAAGLHARLSDMPELAAAAARHGRRLHDVRHSDETFAVGTGAPRRGKRVLGVGTDCSCGKMYTALALEKGLRAAGASADFRATGQTGIFIVGAGVAIDAVVADFISGAVEAVAPGAEAETHWDVVEGQGSLFHPSFAGVSAGLIHGAQPDALVLCHEPTRTHMRGLPDFPIPDLKSCMALNLELARLTNPAARFVGAAVNTAALDAEGARAATARVADEIGLPAVDPVRDGVAPLVAALLA
ncbi:MAG: N-acetyltransferase DgcN [Pseudomonadota bacterium]